nr:PI-type proteinase [uncultured Mediterranean phage uvMED]
MTKLKFLVLVLWLCFCYSSLKADCTNTTIGLCTPGTEEVIVESITEETEQDGTGITTIITTTSDVTTTTISNEDSGDILDGSNGYVLSSKEGDMDSDWGGQGPASMPSGSSCYELGTDKCAMITGSGNNTSTMGVTGMGTTFIQTINISDLAITHGGRTNYTIKVDKQDPQDRIYMHVTGRNGNTAVFSGTDILSETGVTTGYQEYSGGFDFAGSLTTLVVEVGGRDINLAIGPLFDDVSINVLYNVIDTIVTQEITTVEMFVALNTDVSTEIIEVVETIFEFNEPVQDAPVFTLEPMDEPMEDFTYESVEVEIEFEVDFGMEVEMPEFDMPMEMDTEMSMEMEMASLEMEMEMPEVEVNVEPETQEPTMDIQESTNEEPVVENDMDSGPDETEEVEQPDSETTEESPVEDEGSNEQEDIQSEETEEPTEESVEETAEEPKQEIKQEKKQKAATKIVKKMGDKGRYEANNQLKTLIVMQVLADSKSFFVDTQLSEIQGFFTDGVLPDSVIEDNNLAQYYLMMSNDAKHLELENLQYGRN